MTNFALGSFLLSGMWYLLLASANGVQESLQLTRSLHVHILFSDRKDEMRKKNLNHAYDK
jgi:hypothetical protein